MSKTKKPKDRVQDRPIRVLLVEDESSFIEALQIGLGNEGFEVTVATDGAQALERAQVCVALAAVHKHR